MAHGVSGEFVDEFGVVIQYAVSFTIEFDFRDAKVGGGHAVGDGDDLTGF